MAATYLQLPPEQGALRFGPFAGIVHLGSDSRRCQIVLDASQGVYPVHATLAEAPGGLYHFAPTEMGAKCFVVQQGSPQMWPVNSAVQVKSGDSIIVGTPGGPRFQIVGGGPPGVGVSGPVATAGAAAAGGGIMGAIGGMMQPTVHSRRNQNLSQGIADEFARRGRARLMTQSPFRELYTFWHRWRTGALFNPVYIVGTLFTVFGMISAGTVSCSGLLYSLWKQFGGM
ncbi:MAG: hypothetical protein H6737_03315 [Alphaproteobacteria bacterium]|nr:hypothetical protein [Alphaproteobacteria bacterium]